MVKNYILEINDELQNINNSYSFNNLKDAETAIKIFVYYMTYDFEECYENDSVEIYITKPNKIKEKIDYRKYL